jgi:hypothetical protein
VPQRLSRRWTGRGTTAVRALGLLAVVGCCLGAAAYAATTRPSTADEAESAQNVGRPLQPRLTEHPETMTTATVANFDLAQPGRPPRRASRGHSLRYGCRLDGGEWEACRPPVRYGGLDLGGHRFEVRAVNDGGRSGPAAAFAWRVRRAARAPEPGPSPTPVPPSAPIATPTPPAPPVEPPVPPVEPPEGEAEPFTIEQTAALPDLFPGGEPEPIPLRLENPNPVAISVTSLRVSFAAEPPGCPSEENFLITAAGLSVATPLAIAAEASVELPAEGIAPPTIAMRELPVSQDACQGAQLQLSLEGDAVG